MKKLLSLLFVSCSLMGMGKIILYTGPMFSSKSTCLINKFNALASYQVVCAFKPSIDTRYSANNIVSHDGKSIPAQGFNDVKTIEAECYMADAVFFDEIQFAPQSIIHLIEKLKSLNKKVYISGLDKDFRCDSFPITDQVKALAYKVIHLAAKCTYHDCGSPALYTQRIIDGKPAPLTSEVIQVGGAESYQPRCHSCWIKERSE